jgi:CubicO group peptidase (beta-lactamase class C family)
MRAAFTALLVFCALPGLFAGPTPSKHSDYAVMGTAKILCSALFVSGRELDEALVNSGSQFLSAGDFKQLLAQKTSAIAVNRDTGEVRVTLAGYTGIARYHGDQGCVILPPGFNKVFFQPVKLKTALPDAATQDWPMGDRQPAGPQMDGVKLQEAADAAFDGRSLTATFLAVHKGRIIAERYGAGAHKDMQLESWSMGKSLTATLVGLLVQEGRFGLHDPAPVALWRQNPEDPRSRIRVSDLMRMSSGLRFSHTPQPEWEWGRPIQDHLFIYAGAIDAFHFSITRPPEFPPNTVGRYRNCDPLTLGYLIRQTVEKQGENYLAWPQKALFDSIGIRKQVLEPDPHGNFLLSGYDYGTGRNWARLGLLYLQDGVWNGRRMLPEGWVRFVSTPAPGWKDPIYGGQFWVNGNKRWKSLPADAFFMAGAGGQYVIIVPSHHLVVVRMGHTSGGRYADGSLNRSLDKLINALPK